MLGTNRRGHLDLLKEIEMQPNKTAERNCKLAVSSDGTVHHPDDVIIQQTYCYMSSLSLYNEWRSRGAYSYMSTA